VYPERTILVMPEVQVFPWNASKTAAALPADAITSVLGPAGWNVIDQIGSSWHARTNLSYLPPGPRSPQYVRACERKRIPWILTGRVTAEATDRGGDGLWHVSLELYECTAMTLKAEDSFALPDSAETRALFESKVRAFFSRLGFIPSEPPAPPPRPATIGLKLLPALVKQPDRAEAAALPHAEKGLWMELVGPHGERWTSGPTFRLETASPGKWKVMLHDESLRGIFPVERALSLDIVAGQLFEETFRLSVPALIAVRLDPVDSSVRVVGPNGIPKYLRSEELLLARDGSLLAVLEPGPTHIEVSRPGYVTESRDVVLESVSDFLQMNRATVSVTLKRSKAPTAQGPWGQTWVAIPGDSFDIGEKVSIVGLENFETFFPPRRRATVRSFQMTRTEVTVAAYAQCVRTGECTLPATGGTCNWDVTGRDDHPINCVSLVQASDFCRAVGARLPTADESELVARGGTDRLYPWGNEEPTSASARFNAEGTAPVASALKGKSKHGLFDLAGNVAEWTSTPSWDSIDAYVLRGGGWFSGPMVLRSRMHTSAMPDTQMGDIGFRCAR
jgi:formylglycine-generating enzyme required for sulfatase activity